MFSYKILKLHKKIAFHGSGQLQADKTMAVQALLMAELCDGLLPLAYAISFVMAHYGPNAELIGNVGSDYWQYRAVDNPKQTFLMMSVLFAMDMICLTLNSTIIWVFTKINIFKEFGKVLEKYWFIMALKLANNICYHFFLQDINLATDNTFKFAWIRENRKFGAISNSTEF